MFGVATAASDKKQYQPDLEFTLAASHASHVPLSARCMCVVCVESSLACAAVVRASPLTRTMQLNGLPVYLDRHDVETKRVAQLALTEVEALKRISQLATLAEDKTDVVLVESSSCASGRTKSTACPWSSDGPGVASSSSSARRTTSAF